MKILIINDDGVHSRGIIELAALARQHAEVFVVAPSVEQSGVSQAITFLSPLTPVKLRGGASANGGQEEALVGYAVNGTPVDCLKLAISELCPWKPDLVLSGINGGLNAGINVCHSGTVGGAMAAATFDLPSIAVSLEGNLERMDYKKAALIAWPLIEKFSKLELPSKCVVNINIPTVALSADRGEVEIAYVPVETNVMAYHFDQGTDPKGRPYFWSTVRPEPEPSPFKTDAQELKNGKVTVSVLTYDLNSSSGLESLKESVGADRANDEAVKG